LYAGIHDGINVIIYAQGTNNNASNTQKFDKLALQAGNHLWRYINTCYKQHGCTSSTIR